jgi:HK97 family phage portal protein
MANRLMRLIDMIPKTDMPIPATNGNGKHAPEPSGKKALLMTHPVREFFDIADKYLPRDEHAVSGLHAYAVSALVYACMRYRATKLVEPPLWIAEETEDGEEWVEDHELAEVLERPNPDMEMADMLEATHLFLDAGGSALWVKTRDRGGRVAALYPFASDDFAVKASKERLYGEFKVNVAGGTKTLPPEDVIYFRNVDPRDPLSGMAPLDAALAHVNIGQSLRDAVRSQLRRAVKPGSIITIENPFPDEDARNKFKAELQAQYAGAFNAGRPMVLEGAKLEQLPFALKELGLGPIQNDVEVAVCAAFQVHPALVGAKIGVENSGSWADTIASAQNLFYDLYAFPTWARLEKTITRSLLREVDDNPLRFIRFDKTKVRALQADLTKRSTESNLNADTWTVNERRLHTGQDALEDDERGEQIGRAAVDPFGGLFGGIGKGRRGVPERKSRARRLASKGRVVIGSMGPSADERLTLWKQFDAEARALEGESEQAALTIFAAEADDVAAAFASPPKDAETDRFIEAALRKIAEQYRPGGDYHRRWLERYLELIADTFEVGAQGVSAATGVDFNLQNPRVIAAIAERANRLAGNVSATTYEAIQTVVTAGRQDGLGVREIADAIQENVFGGEISEVRAIRIARTETIGALNAGEHTAAIESGVIKSKEWLTQGDGRVRESHAAIDGNRVAINAQFPNGLEYPGDQAGDAADVIQCRCTLLYHDLEA